jgi:hypothetical protein
MTDTPNLGLPYIDGSQAQKHVTHNEALRILDAVVQIGVLDMTLATPPSSPADGERHVVAVGATGAWAGKDNTIATWQDGAWAFLMPKTGWCVWSTADSSLFVFDGSDWQSAGGTNSLDNLAHLGVNMGASSPNLLSVKSNAALFDAIDAAGGGTGDMRIQVSKESSANTASIFFSDGFSGRAEFGLVGADAFKLKVSPDGSSWTEAFNIDQSSGNLTLPRGLALTGVISPAQITADQNNYNPAGLAAASVLQISTDAPRRISGLAGGAEGRCLIVINVGGQPVTLLNESASSSAANRLTLNADLTISAKQAAILRYDGTAARWQAIASGTGLGPAAASVAKSSGYTVVAGDGGVTIRATAALTLSLTAAATLGANFMFDVVNAASSNGVVTIDPNGSETINGALTLKIFPGERATIVCDGSNWSAFGLSPLVLLSQQSVASASSVSFVSLFDDAFSSFEVRARGVLGSTTADLTAQVSTNAGSSYFSGSTDYKLNYVLMDQGGSLSGASIDSSNISLCQISSGSLASFEMELFDLTSAALHKTTQQRQAGASSGGLRFMMSSARLIGANTSVVNAIRFAPSNGTISGTFNLYGRR